MSTPRRIYRTGRETVDRILGSAHDLFVSQGYRATSIRDIARAAGISHPALLRHFDSKHEILTDLVGRLDAAQGGWWTAAAASAEGRPSMADIARRNEATPGWIELFTSLLGEATSPAHPGHALMRERRRVGLDLITYAGRADALDALRIESGWDGLQILWLYFPGEVDIPGHLQAYEQQLEAGARASASDVGSRKANPVPDVPDAQPDTDDSARARALRCAAELYAMHGYHETSLKAVAERAGLTKAALAHIAPTKRELLDLVLTEVIADHRREGAEPGRWLYTLADRPRWVTAADAVLMCEATSPSHPAHEFMQTRLGEARQTARRAVEERRGAGLPQPGDVRSDVEEADWIIALTIGVLIGWLYDPAEVVPRDVMRDPILRLFPESMT